MLLVTVAGLLPGIARSDEGDAPRGKERPSKVFVVRMSDAPAVAYAGGLPGLQATAPLRGQKLDPLDLGVAKYVAYLDGKHGAASSAVGAVRIYDYRYAFNGFAAELTPEQAEKLAQQPGVVSVEKDQVLYADTASTPTFLGLDVPGGLWSRLGGPGTAGDGVIVGIIDSGIWPESLAFTDRTGANGNVTKDGKSSYSPIRGWHGRCEAGEAFSPSMCNQKLIGARHFNAAWGGDAVLKAERPWEFMSARDHNGHGTHTAATAAGNHGVPTTGPAAAFGPTSGMAPHARIAVYKALWSLQGGSTAGGAPSDLVAAIDQAVADGVDVINYSVSGSSTSFRDSVQTAFLYAARAGVFVAASAGNSGPTVGTVAHAGPWITTVAAGTHDRNGAGSVTLGNNVTYRGASVATAVGPAPFIDAVDAGLPGADPMAVRLCFATVDYGQAVLDPARVAGKIVLCERGINARVNKSLAVLEAGGVGMVLVNTAPATLNADFHHVPTVHLADTDRAALEAYAATPGATAWIDASTIVHDVPAPYTASFSSRGPLQASGDLLKPDLIAPGQDIVAAVSPAAAGRSFDLYAGTSMAAAHVAGLAALVKQAHPDWSPMMIKSALMTTGSDVLDGPIPVATLIFRQGAGHANPSRAIDPGLVFDSGWNDWLGFLCGTQLPPSTCTSNAIPVLDPSNLNVASIAIAQLPGTQTVTRTVRSVGAKSETYTFSYTGLDGISVTPSATSFAIARGASKALDVTFAVGAAGFNVWSGGQITWTGSAGHVVRIPVVVKPVPLVAPAQVTGSYDVVFGYDGPFSATPRGLVPAVTYEGSVSTGASKVFQVQVPAGTTYARFSLLDAATAPAGSDLDLRVYRGGLLVGSSGGATSTEDVNLENPVATTYTVVVDGYATGNPSTFTLFAWLLDATAAGNMLVSAPTQATPGATGTIDLAFSGLSAGVRYLGSVVYGGPDGMPKPTIVRVDP